MPSAWKAAPHKWGEGKLHALDGDRALCGKSIDDYQGTHADAGWDEISCKGCQLSRQSREGEAVYQQEWEERQRQREIERQQWWEWYDAYLTSPTWELKRKQVIKRAAGWCEGCGTRRAFQVHRLTYANVGAEFLWELRAVCENCHGRLHQR